MDRVQNEVSDIAQVDQEPSLEGRQLLMILSPLKEVKIMGYKLKSHSGAKSASKNWIINKVEKCNRNHILTKQSTKRKRHNRGLNKMGGTVLKMASN